MTTFTYPLTDNQYRRFQHATNTQELNTLGKLVNTKVIMTEKDHWSFDGWFKGTGFIGFYAGSHWLVIQVDKRPWWCPRFLLDSAFRKSLV